jgi:uncharacterized protein
MQAKDTNRLSVLRSLLTQTLNASKTAHPIKTDLQMLALLRKSASASRLASEEFRGAGRQDLAEKEETQMKIMEEYADGVETLTDEDIVAAVRGIVDEMKDKGSTVQMGEVMKRVLAADILGEKPVARGDVARIVKQVLVES